MKTTPFLLLGLFILSLSSCREETEYRVITLTGAESAYNLSRSSNFGSFMDTDSVVPVTVADGDLLFVTQDEFERAMYFAYREDMEGELSMYFDTLNTSALYLNGKLHFIDLSRENEALELLNQSERRDLGSVESVALSLPLEGELRDLLFDKFRPNQRLNLVLEGYDSLGQMDELFRRFYPEWLVMSDLEWDHGFAGWITGLKDTRLLLTSLPDGDSLLFFTGLPGLEQLIVSVPDGREFPQLSLEPMKELESLGIIDAGSLDLSFLKNATFLENLFVMNAGTVTGMEALSSLDELEGLGFTASRVEGSLPVLPSLTWMCLPLNMGQREFDAFCSRQPEIQVLEAVKNEEITDLSALQKLPLLTTLVMGLPGAGLNRLQELSQLELLIIDQHLMEDSVQQVEMLRTSLPGTRIVPGGGFCLGSGWLLLLLPLLLAASLLPWAGKKLFPGKGA